MPRNGNFESWGRYPRVEHRGVIVPEDITEVGTSLQSRDSSILPRGMGRSYGDSCLNEGGYLLLTKYLNKFHSFDHNTGILRCEAGVTLDEILRVFVPRGWFLPVTPGTKFVTIGGAIANDVHGKNHHKSGSFGNNVIQFELQRSDGTRLICDRSNNSDWFHATVGGIGLTGVILWAELKLKRVSGPYVDVETIKVESLNELLEISHEFDENYEYTVSWLDCLDRRDIRGIFIRGNHGDRAEKDTLKTIHKNAVWKTFPFDAPSFLLSNPTMKAYNFLHYHKQRKKIHRTLLHYDPFFYPLDSIHKWNRMYGKRGYLQYQCVLPIGNGNQATRSIFKKVLRCNIGPYLVIFKEFGKIQSEGFLSFPMHGLTLAMEFPNVGGRLYDLFKLLDAIVVDAGGRIYPAKDARMSRETFVSSYQRLDDFTRYIDPKLSSSFYRRVGG